MQFDHTDGTTVSAGGDCVTQDVTYSWSKAAAICPTTCGTAASSPADFYDCVGSDGSTGNAASKCGTAPSTTTSCAAIPACPTFIRVTEATYGYHNCGGGSSQTNNLAAACDGQSSCTYRVNHGAIGDPSYGCPKRYHYNWCCGDGNNNCHGSYVSEEASGKSFTMSC